LGFFDTASAFPSSTFLTLSANLSEQIDSEESFFTGETCTNMRVLLFFSRESWGWRGNQVKVSAEVPSTSNQPSLSPSLFSDLQEIRQRAVAVRHVGGLVGSGGDDVTQGGEGLVDGLGLRRGRESTEK
jgi:hypothetical protein